MGLKRVLGLWGFTCVIAQVLNKSKKRVSSSFARIKYEKKNYLFLYSGKLDGMRALAKFYLFIVLSERDR